MRVYKMKAENLLNYSLRKKCVNRRLNKLCSNTVSSNALLSLSHARAHAHSRTHAQQKDVNLGVERVLRYE